MTRGRAATTRRGDLDSRPRLIQPRTIKVGGLVVALALLAACASQAADAVRPGAPGFLLGVWHGFILPVAWLLSLFMDNVALYAVPNNGGWYDFGFIVGVMVFGVGARKTHVVYRDRVVRVRE